MKRNYSFLFLIVLSKMLLAQNNIPNVQINNLTVDTSLKIITINFDALDSDNDSLEISVWLSADSATSFVCPTSQVTGDVGFPVPSGTNKTAVITYQNDSLYYAANGNLQAWFMAKIVASDRKNIAIENMIQNIDSALIYSYMNYIAKPRHHIAAPAGLSTIKDSIEANFIAHQLQTTRTPFNFSTYGGQNILGRKPGLLQEKNTIIVDAHFDAVANSPGADDNGSSLAAVLIASKILAPYTFEKTLQFIGFDKEENGLLGSTYYVNNSIPPYQNTEAVLNMEMIGYYNDAPNSQTVPTGFSQLFPAAVDSITASGNQGVWLFTVGNSNSTALSLAFDTIARNYVPQVKSLVLNVPGNGQIAQDLRRSDHAAFWDAGYKALMLTDGADFRNPNYHTSGDSLATLNFPFLERNIGAVTAVAATLAKPISAGYAISQPWQIIKDVPFSLPEFSSTIGIDIFPNPTKNELYLKADSKLSNAKFELIDQHGKTILSTTILSAQEGEIVAIQLPTQGIASGIYFVRIVQGSLLITKKIIISESSNDSHHH